MGFVFGIILFFVSITLLVLGLINMSLRPYYETLIMMFIGFICNFISIYIIYTYSGNGLDIFQLSLIIFIIGIIQTLLGIWIYIWGPLPFTISYFTEANILLRNGILTILLAIFLLSLSPEYIGYVTNLILMALSINNQEYGINIKPVNVGILSFTQFSLLVLAFTNIVFIKRDYDLSKIIKRNILTIFVLAILYVIMYNI